jgi:epsilon-lactone hydrolase
MGDEQRFARAVTNKASVVAEPSWSLRRHLRIEKRICHGWPVFVLDPRAGRSDHRVLYLHGGAYVHGPFGAHWRIISRLIQRTRAQVTVPLYPLAPRHTWRDALRLLEQVYAEMATQQNTANITFTGDSAGGGLALAFAQVLREKAQPLPGKLVLLSPWLDVTFSDPKQLELAGIDRMLATPGPRWAGRVWAGDLPPEDPRVSPLFGSLSGLPPIALFTGTADLLNSDARRLKTKAKSEGATLEFHEYEGLFHVWMAAPIPEAKKALDEIAAFIRTRAAMTHI